MIDWCPRRRFLQGLRRGSVVSLKLPQLGKKAHAKNDPDEVNVEISHINTYDVDWWVRKRVEMQSDNQSQNGEEAL
jgi:hypothetical protein